MCAIILHILIIILHYFRYDLASRNIEVVGCWLGNYLRQMKRVNPEVQLWGIGHSLGAHLVSNPD